MFTVMCILAVAGLIGAILALMGKVPIGPVVLIMAIAEALHCIPIR